MRNGIYAENLLLRGADDDAVYIYFPHRIHLIESNDYAALDSLMACNGDSGMGHGSANIIIDMRLQYLVMYSIVKYGDDTLVYDVYNLRVQTIYNYLSHQYNVDTTYLSVEKIHQIAMMWILFCHTLRPLHIRWNVANIIVVMHKDIIETMMNYIHPLVDYAQQAHMQMEHVNRLVDIVKNYYSARTNAETLAGYSIYELYCALSLLKTAEFMYA